jgi:hypothetical protein
MEMLLNGLRLHLSVSRLVWDRENLRYNPSNFRIDFSNEHYMSQKSKMSLNRFLSYNVGMKETFKSWIFSREMSGNPKSGDDNSSKKQVGSSASSGKVGSEPNMSKIDPPSQVFRNPLPKRMLEY